MQQAIAFATTAGLGFWVFRSQIAKTNTGTDLMGVDIQHVSEPEIYQPAFTPSLHEGHPGPAILRREDNTTDVQTTQQDLINTAKFESRHFLMDPFRFRGEATQVNIQDTTLPTPSNWTKGHDQ